MSTFSLIERALIELLGKALPAGVKVTALPVQQAAASKPRERRVNVALLRAAPDPVLRNAPTPEAVRGKPTAASSRQLDFLISIHCPATPATDLSASSLIETALLAIESNPLLTVASEASAANKTPTRATVAIIDQSVQEWAQLWTALQSPWQPAILVRVRIS